MSPAGAGTDPANVVIFGASGDLTRRKLVPALHSLTCERLLPPESRVIGVARSPLSDDAFAENLFQGVEAYARYHLGLCERWPLKAGVVQTIVEGTAQWLPAQQVQPAAGQLAWLLDAAAARLIGG